MRQFIGAIVFRKSRREGEGVIALALVLLLTAMCARAHAVEVEMKARLCEETHSICSWYRAVITPPTGWEEDATYGDQNLVTVFAPKSKKVLIYVNTDLAKPGSSLEDEIRVYQKTGQQGTPTPIL
jgi:hypothetical protein